MGMLKLTRLSTLAVLVWICVLFYISVAFFSSGRSPTQEPAAPNIKADSSETVVRLSRALNDVEFLRKENSELKKVLGSNHIRIARNHLSSGGSKEASNDPQSRGVSSLSVDKLRMNVENGVSELWFYISQSLVKLRNKGSEKAEIDQVLRQATAQKRTVIHDLKSLEQARMADWIKADELRNLSNVVQKRIEKLQNPSDCNKARKLVCNLNKGCGFGCQIHHVAYCFVVAYGTERTMILNSKGWRYAAAGWDVVFQPVSKTCHAFTSPPEVWAGEQNQKNVPVISLPIVDSLHPRPPYLPLAFPADISEKLLQLHGNPPVWWMGQIVKYLMRYQPDLKKELSTISKKIGFQGPIVGIHVRRTDKVGSEAAFHPLSEYMQWAEEYFSQLMLDTGDYTIKKRVYLATDDPQVFEDAKEFKEWEFVGDKNIAQSAQLDTRYSDNSLRGIIIDIHFLSLTDYLACTFSSQVCRLAYELMQTIRNDDASSRFHSLDDIYYFGGQDAHEQVVKYPHKALNTEEIDMTPGDVIGIAGNHWDGFSKGANRRTGKSGLYPSYKVEEKWRIVDFPKDPDSMRIR